MSTNEKIAARTAAISTPAALAEKLEQGKSLGNYVKITKRQRDKAVEFLRSMDHAAAASEAFECRIYDGHCPSMTVRFQVPQGFPLAGGIYRIERIRSATPEDAARFDHLPEPPEVE